MEEPTWAVQRAEIRILSNWADAQRMDAVRDLLRKAEAEVAAHVEHRRRLFCTTDIGDGSTIYDTRPRA